MDKAGGKDMSQEEIAVLTKGQPSQGRSGCCEDEEEVGSTAT